MHVNPQSVVAVAGGALVLQQAIQRVGLPMLRGIRQGVRNFGKVATVILGDPDKTDEAGRPTPVPSLAATLAALKTDIAEVKAEVAEVREGQGSTAEWTREHQAWHSGAGRANGPMSSAPNHTTRRS